MRKTKLFFGGLYEVLGVVSLTCVAVFGLVRCGNLDGYLAVLAFVIGGICLIGFVLECYAIGRAMYFEITRIQAEAMIDFLEAEFIQGIGSEHDSKDNEYVQNIRSVYDKLNEMVGDAE